MYAMYVCSVDLRKDEEGEDKPSLTSTESDISEHKVLRKGHVSRRIRSKKGYAVDSVGKHEDKVGHKEAVNSFLSKFPL